MQSHTSMPLKPSVSVTYPPFKHGMYMEEYFDQYWHKQDFPEKDRMVYLDVYWHNVFHHNGGSQQTMPHLKSAIETICKKAHEENKVVFTVYQWDELFLNGQAPSNLHIFSVGTTYTIPLPLLVEDSYYTLRKTQSKLSYSQKDILASFIGSITHSLRSTMVQHLNAHSNIRLCARNSWNIDVPKDHVNEFIEITKRSKFGLAPRGYGPSSFRFFEIMELGAIPVYIHDGVNALPYQEILDYSRFSIVIHINEIHSLPARLQSITEEAYTSMLNEVNRVRPWFTMEGMCMYVREYMTKKLEEIS